MGGGGEREREIMKYGSRKKEEGSGVSEWGAIWCLRIYVLVGKAGGLYGVSGYMCLQVKLGGYMVSQDICACR